MKTRKNTWIFILGIAFLSIYCNRGSGCEATEFAQKKVNVNNEKQATFKASKKKSAAKSSVMPAEVKATKSRKR
jgi:hypothetical protein